jgi:hypothetical protein
LIRPPFSVDYGMHISKGARSIANVGLVALDLAALTTGDDVQSAPTRSCSPRATRQSRARWQSLYLLRRKVSDVLGEEPPRALRLGRVNSRTRRNLALTVGSTASRTAVVATTCTPGGSRSSSRSS